MKNMNWRRLLLPVFFCLIVCMSFLSVQAPASSFDPDVVEKIIKAKALMKKGVDSWDPEWLKKAREQFLGLLAKDKQENLYLFYYVALCDYRLANYFLISSEMEKVEPYLKEGLLSSYYF